VLTGSNKAKNSGFIQRQPVLELGWVWYAREVVLYGRVEPAVADELRALVSEDIQRPSAEARWYLPLFFDSCHVIGS
jgi:hypothetical protein